MLIILFIYLILSGKLLSGNNCVLLGHTKYKGVQLIYCNPFPAKQFQPGPRHNSAAGYRQWCLRSEARKTVWYARVLLLFSASVTTDTGSKAFDCALVSTFKLETYDDPENGYYCNYMYYAS